MAGSLVADRLPSAVDGGQYISEKKEEDRVWWPIPSGNCIRSASSFVLLSKGIKIPRTSNRPVYPPSRPHGGG